MQVCESPLHSCSVCEFYSVMSQALSVVMSLEVVTTSCQQYARSVTKITRRKNRQPVGVSVFKKSEVSDHHEEAVGLLATALRTDIAPIADSPIDFHALHRALFAGKRSPRGF